MMQSRVLCVLASVLALTGCLQKQYEEKDAHFSVASKTITVPSDRLDDGGGSVKDTVWVSSNRSWNAVFEQEVDWVKMGESGNLNLAKVSGKVGIPLVFEDNMDPASRSVNLRVCHEGGDEIVTIVQSAVEYKLILGSDPEDFKDLDYAEDTYTLKVNTNDSWTVALKDGSAVSCTFSPNGGTGSAAIEVTVAENPDMEPKTGTIVISSANCEPIELPISQIAAAPYVKFPENKSDFTALDGFGNFVIPVISNANWTASIESAEGYPEGSVTTTASGDKTVKTAEIKFPASIDFSKKMAVITVKFTVQGAAEPVYATISQAPAIAIAFGDPHLDVMHIKDSNMYSESDETQLAAAKSYWPFSYMEMQDGPGVWTACTAEDLFTWLKSTRLANTAKVIRWTLNNGYVMYSYGQTKGYQRSPKYGWSWGAVVGDYFSTPVVEGRRISKIVLVQRSSMLKLQVKDSFGTNFGSAISTTKEGPTDLTIDMKGSLADTEYRVTLTGTYWYRIGQVTFYYE